MQKRLAALIGYIVLIFVLPLLILEVLGRLGVPGSALYEEDKRIGAITAKEGSPRILILGDSFSVEGENHWATLLRQDLEEKGAVVLNLSKMGEGVSFYLHQLQRHGPAFRPDVILLNYFAGNDLTDTQYHRSPKEQVKGTIKRIRSSSYALYALSDLYQRRALQRRIANISKTKAFETSDGKNVANPFLFEISAAHPDYFADNLWPTKPASLDAWLFNKAEMTRIMLTAKSMNAKLFAQIFPADVQVEKTNFDFYRGLGFRIDDAWLKEGKPQEEFLKFCHVNGIESLDILPHLRAQTGTPLYLSRDSHWNEAGHRVVYQLLKNHLVPRLANQTPARPIE